MANEKANFGVIIDGFVPTGENRDFNTYYQNATACRFITCGLGSYGCYVAVCVDLRVFCMEGGN